MGTDELPPLPGIRTIDFGFDVLMGQIFDAEKSRNCVFSAWRQPTSVWEGGFTEKGPRKVKPPRGVLIFLERGTRCAICFTLVCLKLFWHLSQPYQVFKPQKRAASRRAFGACLCSSMLRLQLQKKEPFLYLLSLYHDCSTLSVRANCCSTGELIIPYSQLIVLHLVIVLLL